VHAVCALSLAAIASLTVGSNPRVKVALALIAIHVLQLAVARLLFAEHVAVECEATPNPTKGASAPPRITDQSISGDVPRARVVSDGTLNSPCDERYRSPMR
jgi:hypothetical protein